MGVLAALAVFVAAMPGLAVSESGRIYVDGKPVARGTEPAWSRDGSRLAYVRGGALYVARADGSGEHRVVAPPADSPSWSPDGKRIVFSTGRDIVVVRLADGRRMRLAHGAKPYLLNVTPSYSPDGARIAFARSLDAYNTDIFVMRADGTQLRRVTRSPASDSTFGEEHGPAWSPDGRTLVYVSNRRGVSWELYRIDVNGGREQRLTNTPSRRYNENAPRFSRDGTEILYVHDGRVAVVRADGTDVRELGAGDSADWCGF
jgi:TolB protein